MATRKRLRVAVLGLAHDHVWSGLKRVPLDDLHRGERDPLEYFARCIHIGKHPQGLCSPDLGRAAQEIMEAGLRSATSGR